MLTLPQLLLIEFSRLLNLSPIWNGTIVEFSSLIYLIDNITN